jgi:hypothetical protein
LRPDDEFMEINEYLQSYHMDDDLLSSKILSDRNKFDKYKFKNDSKLYSNTNNKN